MWARIRLSNECCNEGDTIAAPVFVDVSPKFQCRHHEGTEQIGKRQAWESAVEKTRSADLVPINKSDEKAALALSEWR